MTVNKNSNKKTLPIYSMKLAGLAMYRGFVLQFVDKSKDSSGRNIFYFNNTPELVDFINEYRILKKCAE